MKTSVLKSLASAIILTLSVTGCSSIDHDDKHASTKNGAIGGALLGLTLGALTGDAELAAKAALAGGVAGGVAGSTADLANSRENERDKSRDQAISNIGNNTQDTSNQNASNQNNNTANDSWSELTNFMGDWDVSISGLHAQQPIKATAKANGVLVKTTEAQINIDQVQLNGELVDINLTTQFSYDTEEGYQAIIKNKSNDQSLHFSGEYQPALNRYNFYPTSSNALLTSGTTKQDFRLELGFVGKTIWVLDTYAIVDGQEVKIQSYRFSKKS